MFMALPSCKGIKMILCESFKHQINIANNAKIYLVPTFSTFSYTPDVTTVDDFFQSK